MKQEPVAWMSPDGKVSQTEGKLFHIPLYAVPKPLSDDEICQLWKQSQEDGVGMNLGHTTQEHYFARLIEERHGIK